MAHVIIITTPPSAGGGGSRVADEGALVVEVRYAPPHGMDAEEEHRNIRQIERMSERFYNRLQAALIDPEGEHE